MTLLMEFVMLCLVSAGAFIAVPTVCLGFLTLFDGFPRVKIGQIAGLVAVSAWVFGLFATGQSNQVEWYLLISLLLVLLLFFGLWRREFRLLMLRGDEEFPGRLDKLGWFLMLTIAAPAGVWLFRSYRRARWPEPVAAKPSGRSSPWDEERTDAPSPSPVGVE